MMNYSNLEPSHHVIGKYVEGAKHILKHPLGGQIPNMIHKRSAPAIDGVISHIKNLGMTRIGQNPSLLLHRGGSGVMGGGVSMGGSVHLGGALLDNRDSYHFVLNLSPHEFECLREIAVQLMGGKPSHMWGRMVSGREPLEAGIDDYQDIVRMPNQHAASKMLEAESGYGQGGGFGKAFRHVARIGSKILKAGHHALKFIDRNKDLLLQAIPDEYKGEAEAFLETANRIDDAVNPIVDATIDAVKQGATKEDKEKLKKLAEDKIKKVVEDKVPRGKEILKLAEDLNQNVVKPIYAQ
jgi:hypothetical protein